MYCYHHAVLFISVGMLIHWKEFYQNCFMMRTLLVVILAGKSFVFGAVISALGGLPVRTAVACRACIPQAGEFTFVIASKGQALLLLSALTSAADRFASSFSSVVASLTERCAGVGLHAPVSLMRLMHTCEAGFTHGLLL